MAGACLHQLNLGIVGQRYGQDRLYRHIFHPCLACAVFPVGFLDSIDRTLQLLLDPPEMHTSRNSPLYSSLILLVPNMGDLPEASKSDSGENFRFPPLSALPSPQPSSSLSPRRSPASLDSGSGGTPGQGPASLFLGMVNTSGASRRGSCIAPRGGTPGRC